MRHEIIGASGIEFVLPRNIDLNNCLVFIGGLLHPECTYTLLRETPKHVPADRNIRVVRKSLVLRTPVTDADIIVIAL